MLTEFLGKKCINYDVGKKTAHFIAAATSNYSWVLVSQNNFHKSSINYFPTFCRILTRMFSKKKIYIYDKFTIFYIFHPKPAITNIYEVICFTSGCQVKIFHRANRTIDQKKKRKMLSSSRQ